MRGRRLRRVGVIAPQVFLIMFCRSTIQAQAWIPEQGQALISMHYAYGDIKDHLSKDYIVTDLGRVYSHAVHVDLEYGISNNVALSASAPAIVSQYVGTKPHQFEGEATDDDIFRGGFQDFEFKVRYMSLLSPLVVTPFMSVVIPSHDYKSFGHTSVGRDLRELHVGLYLGKLATFISDNLYTEVGYDFAYVEKLDDISANRSTVDFTLGYFATPTVTVSTTMLYLNTHGGVIPSDIKEINDAIGWHDHDRHTAAEYFNLGGSISVAVSDASSFFVSYTSTLWGKNVMAPRTIALGSTWSFQTSE